MPWGSIVTSAAANGAAAWSSASSVAHASSSAARCPSDPARTILDVNGTAETEIASALDLRLASIWSELFEVPPEQWTHDLIGWFLRAAYGQGYCDAIREPETGALCRELGLSLVPRDE
jgi:hypothetical protein